MQNGHNISTEKIREIHCSAVVLQLKVIIEKNFLWAIPRLQSFHKETGGPRDNLWLGWGEGMTPRRVLYFRTHRCSRQERERQATHGKEEMYAKRSSWYTGTNYPISQSSTPADTLLNNVVLLLLHSIYPKT